MEKPVLNIIAISLLMLVSAYSQKGNAKFCIDAEPLCSGLFYYPNTSGANFAETGPDYGCLISQLNPAWFYLQIAEGGNLQLKIEQSTVIEGVPNLDTDFIVYGPFNDPVLPCTNELTSANIIDCSFARDFVEFVDIDNALVGSYYLLMIQNYSLSPGFVTVTQTAGSAITNCNLLNAPIESSVKACEGDVLTLDATTINSTHYIWYADDGSGNFFITNSSDAANLDVTESKIYRAEAYDINNVFLESYEFNVTFYPAPVISAEVVSNAFIQDNDIQVTAIGNGLQKFEFSIDNKAWQEYSVFKNVSIGEHVISVRNTIGCGETSITVMVMDYPHYFTPNGDGFHDTWNIVGIENQLKAKIYVYDRYGKLLKQLTPNGFGWDGTFNGKLLSTDDYWFTVDYVEPRDGQIKQFKSHFTLKR